MVVPYSFPSAGVSAAAATTGAAGAAGAAGAVVPGEAAAGIAGAGAAGAAGAPGAAGIAAAGDEAGIGAGLRAARLSRDFLRVAIFVCFSSMRTVMNLITRSLTRMRRSTS